MQNKSVFGFVLTLLVGLILTATSVLADTYTGVVSEIKHFSKGGVAVDMDGTYPNQKMVLYVPKSKETEITLPTVGAKVTATGSLTQYEGHPEIRINAADQWKW